MLRIACVNGVELHDTDYRNAVNCLFQKNKNNRFYGKKITEDIFSLFFFKKMSIWTLL